MPKGVSFIPTQTGKMPLPIHPQDAVMLDFRRVRSITELNNFLFEFETLSNDDKEEILIEMVVLLNEYKLKESQADLFGPPQAEKSVVRRSGRKRRPR